MDGKQPGTTEVRLTEEQKKALLSSPTSSKPKNDDEKIQEAMEYMLPISTPPYPKNKSGHQTRQEKYMELCGVIAAKSPAIPDNAADRSKMANEITQAAMDFNKALTYGTIEAIAAACAKLSAVNVRAMSMCGLCDEGILHAFDMSCLKEFAFGGYMQGGAWVKGPAHRDTNWKDIVDKQTRKE